MLCHDWNCKSKIILRTEVELEEELLVQQATKPKLTEIKIIISPELNLN